MMTPMRYVVLVLAIIVSDSHLCHDFGPMLMNYVSTV